MWAASYQQPTDEGGVVPNTGLVLASSDGGRRWVDSGLPNSTWTSVYASRQSDHVTCVAWGNGISILKNGNRDSRHDARAISGSALVSAAAFAGAAGGAASSDTSPRGKVRLPGTAGCWSRINHAGKIAGRRPPAPPPGRSRVFLRPPSLRTRPPAGNAAMDSISRHEQLLRVFHLIDILFSARSPLTTAELKDRLCERGAIDEMSDKNLRRDLDFLEKFGYAVKRTKKQSPRGAACQAWSIEPGKGAAELKTPVISLPELLSLAVAREFLTPLAGTLYWRGISQLLAKLERVATPQLLEYVAEHKDGLLVHPRPSTTKYRSRTLNAINRAIRNSLELDIRYTSLADEKPRKYTIRPEALVVYDGSVYIAGYRVAVAAKPGGKGAARPARPGAVVGVAAIRFFKLDRVADAKPTSRTFTRRSESVESLLADSITIFRSTDPPRRYKIRVKPARARWACEKPFHPRQKVRRQSDGSVILEIERAWDDEMVPQLLGLADMVEVLEPLDVRDRLLETAQRIAAIYMCHHLRSFEALRAGG
jgi:predicted DNA-binding transcriptional regulator YafY